MYDSEGVYSSLIDRCMPLTAPEYQIIRLKRPQNPQNALKPALLLRNPVLGGVWAQPLLTIYRFLGILIFWEGY